MSQHFLISYYLNIIAITVQFYVFVSTKQNLFLHVVVPSYTSEIFIIRLYKS